MGSCLDEVGGREWAGMFVYKWVCVSIDMRLLAVWFVGLGLKCRGLHTTTYKGLSLFILINLL